MKLFNNDNSADFPAVFIRDFCHPILLIHPICITDSSDVLSSPLFKIHQSAYSREENRIMFIQSHVFRQCFSWISNKTLDFHVHDDLCLHFCFYIGIRFLSSDSTIHPICITDSSDVLSSLCSRYINRHIRGKKMNYVIQSRFQAVFLVDFE